jgi:trehalose synthase
VAAPANLHRVTVGSAPINRFRSLLDAQSWSEFETTMRMLARALQGRVVWNVNSTARGGGVAELLAQLIQYDRGVGIDERWLVIEGSEPFFDVTKRIHSLLHGVASDGSDISPDEREVYESTLDRNAAALVDSVGVGDIVIIHDPQAAGLVPALAERAHVIWRSHVGIDEPNENARKTWNFLRPYLERASAYVFSRPTYVWEGLDPARVHIFPPCIDPFAIKNQDLSNDSVVSILNACGVMQGGRPSDDAHIRVSRRAAIVGEALPDSARFVLQVSRWDPLKDPVGVMEGFAQHVAPRTDSWLVLAGPGTKSVRDDPEQPKILADVLRKREAIEPGLRRRVLVAQLPMDDTDENAAMVNALQRRADVVVQKSLAEGFGLTVAEAMWKERPVVASRVGGIEDQIEHERSGLLVDEPKDLRAFGDAVVRLIDDRPAAARLGREARRQVARHYLAPRLLKQQADLLLRLVA